MLPTVSAVGPLLCSPGSTVKECCNPSCDDIDGGLITPVAGVPDPQCAFHSSLGEKRKPYLCASSALYRGNDDLRGASHGDTSLKLVDELVLGHRPAAKSTLSCGLQPLAEPLRPGVPVVKLDAPIPLFSLPPACAVGLGGGCTLDPGFQFDLVRMRQLGIPDSVIEQLRVGVRFGFDQEPLPYFTRNHGSARATAEAARVVHEDLMRLYNLGKLADLQSSAPTIVHPLGLVLKPDKVRVVVDASISGLNDAMQLIYHPLPTALSAVQLMTKGCWMAKIDVSDAYLSIPVHPDERCYLGVECPLTGRFFQYNFCPFGVRNSGPLFCEINLAIVEAVKREWERHGICARICSYSDDSLIVADTEQECAYALAVAYQTFTAVGMKIKPSKLVHPCQVIDFIGVLFDSVKGVMGVTESRREQLLTELHDVLSARGGSYEQWERLLGRLTFVADAVPGVGGALQPLHRLLPARVTQRFAQLQQKKRWLSLVRPVEKALGWIIRRLQARCFCRLHVDARGSFFVWSRSFAMPADVLLHQSQITLMLDTSGSFGWGVSWLDAAESRAGQWTAGWLTKNINMKELYCFLIALQWWGPSWQASGLRRILAFSDNTAAVGCMNKLRSSRPGMDQICQRIRELLAQYGLEVVAVHIPGVQNVLADGLSRGTIAPCTSEFSFSRRGLFSALQFVRFSRQEPYMELVPLTHASKPHSCGLLAGSTLQFPGVHLPAHPDVMVGVLPRHGAVQILRRILLARRKRPGLRCAFLVPLRNRFQTHWGSFYRYYRRLRPSALSKGSLNWVITRKLDSSADEPVCFESCALPEAHVLIGF